MFEGFERSTAVEGSLKMKLIFINICLASIGVVSCFNGIIAFSLIVTIAGVIVKVYKLDPEPFILLSLHTVITCLMFHDAPTTLAVIVAVAASCMAAGSTDVSSERIATLLVSMAISAMLGKLAAALAAIGLVVAIVTLKLRPMRPAVYSVLVLLLLAASVPINSSITASLSAILIIASTSWFFLWRFHRRTELLYLEQCSQHQNGIVDNNNKNITNNNKLLLMNGTQLRLSNINDSLDLHGHTVTSALKALHQFLKEHEDFYRSNRTGHTRILKVITGEEGKNHPEDSLNLIKPTVVNFLKINKYRFHINPERPGILKVDLESHLK